MVKRAVRREHQPMNKRVAATILWFVAGWYGAGLIALALGLPEIIGPIAGFVSATFIGLDPLGIIWPRSRMTAVAEAAPEDVQQDLAEAA
jgi:hypothetical protein